MSVDGATATAVFRVHLEQVLMPMLVPGNIVIKDNVSIHKVGSILEVTEAAGATLLYLPPSSPDDSPSESSFPFLTRAHSVTCHVMDRFFVLSGQWVSVLVQEWMHLTRRIGLTSSNRQ